MSFSIGTQTYSLTDKLKTDITEEGETFKAGTTLDEVCTAMAIARYKALTEEEIKKENIPEDYKVTILAELVSKYGVKASAADKMSAFAALKAQAAQNTVGYLADKVAKPDTDTFGVTEEEEEPPAATKTPPAPAQPVVKKK